MAQPPQPQHRPSFTTPATSFSHPSPYPQQNGRPQFSPQSPGGPVAFTSTSPQPQFSPSNHAGQVHPSKKARISPDGPSQIPQTMHTPQAGSPVNGQMNGITTNSPRPGSMAPPQAPTLKKEERNDDSVMLKDVPNAGPNSAFSPSANNNNNMQMPSPHNPVQRVMPANGLIPPSTPINHHVQPMTQLPIVSPEERARREQERKDWEESRHAQHELWNSFLYGASLNEKLKQASAKSNLSEPQAGVLVNTQKNQPPPRVRVNALEGGTRIIDKGQSILDTKDKADRLNDLVKLLSLAAKARITGLIQNSSQLAIERRQHSQGRVPEEWSDIAAPVKSHKGGAQKADSPAPMAGVKRSHTEANEQTQPNLPKHPAATAFRKVTSRQEQAEKARQAKRRKRNEFNSAQEQEAAEKAEAEAVAAALDADRKTTKKERKMEQSRVSEQQQHASTNEAARLALSTANLLGRSKNKKSYAWMSGGSNTPGRPSGAAATQKPQSTTDAPKAKVPGHDRDRLGGFDESSEGGIQARDILAILENDGRAARSYVKGSSIVDESIVTSKS